MTYQIIHDFYQKFYIIFALKKKREFKKLLFKFIELEHPIDYTAFYIG